jgi:hypothetical protein
MSTLILDQFLQEIGNIFRQRDGTRLQDVLQLEPPLPPAYSRIVSELKAHFPKGQDQALVTRCEQTIPVAEDGIGSAWGAFPDFLARYFRFLRDADPSNLADLFEKLKSLTKSVKGREVPHQSLTRLQPGHNLPQRHDKRSHHPANGPLPVESACESCVRTRQESGAGCGCFERPKDWRP